MRWRSLRGRFAECPERPFLLEDRDRAEQAADLRSLGFETVDVEVAGARTGRDPARSVGDALGFPGTFRGGWDAFMDLLLDRVVEPRRFVVVEVSDAGEVATTDIRMFVRLVGTLMDATRLVEARGAGDAQLEFIFRGAWSSAGRPGGNPPR
jgi:hypothetical protein